MRAEAKPIHFTPISIRRAIQVALSVTFVALSTTSAQPPAPEEGSALTVYVLTFGQGDDVWEKFGHNAIWIHDPQHASDITYNWGMFSFDEPQFIRRFLSGNTHYWMAGIPLEAILQEYRQRN